MNLNPVNFEAPMSYKVGKTNFDDKSLLEATMKTLEMPEVKDLKEARRQVY